MPRILFLTQVPQSGAAARYRVYQYLDYLKDSGIEFTVSPAVTEMVLESYIKSPRLANKINYYTSIVVRRIFDLFCLPGYDAVFLQRDILVHTYPFMEKMIALSGKKIIFDFDDAIYLYPLGKTPGFLFSLLWDKRKIERIIKLSKHVIAGNSFLKKYAENFTKNVTIIPTSVDLNLYKPNPRIRDSISKITIGWIGSQGTFIYLKQIFPVVRELSKKYDIELRVVGAKGPSVDGLKIIYENWDLSTEIADIHSFDIGVMPLTDDEWSRGKSGTKLLQYMAAGIPAVASPVGINAEIIKDGINGFLADNQESWVEKITELIENKQLRSDMVKRARNDVEQFYSVQANAPKLINVFKEVLKQD